MNSNTGEIRSFTDEQAEKLSSEWVQWNIGEKIEVRGCFFRVHSVNPKGNRITLKAISRSEWESK